MGCYTRINKRYKDTKLAHKQSSTDSNLKKAFFDAEIELDLIELKWKLIKNKYNVYKNVEKSIVFIHIFKFLEKNIEIFNEKINEYQSIYENSLQRVSFKVKYRLVRETSFLHSLVQRNHSESPISLT